jgi:hypothetical protein
MLACSSGGGSETAVTPASTTKSRLEIDAMGSVTDESVGVGERADFVFVLSSVPATAPFEGVAVDLRETLANLSVSTAQPITRFSGSQVAAAASVGATAQVTVRVGSAADELEVCDSGFVYGPYIVPLDGVAEPAPASVDARPATVELVNVGDVSFCVSVVPSEPVVFTVDRLVLEAETCDVEADDLAGIWQGDYTCSNSCGDAFGGSVEIQITQDGFNARYTDEGGGEFRGTICGSRFRFSGGYGCDELVCGEIESGTFTRTAENRARKTSSYEYYDLTQQRICTGDCQDTLERMPIAVP